MAEKTGEEELPYVDLNEGGRDKIVSWLLPAASF
jgi:hypothetical protein